MPIGYLAIPRVTLPEMITVKKMMLITGNKEWRRRIKE
jgi:hypothetical protein